MASLGNNQVNYATGTAISAANLNAIQQYINQYTVPTYSTANNNQVLMIVNGSMQWVILQSAENATF